ncbi:MAG: aminoglycoside phosphotransferase family protein [Pseudomonadota bacterium]
MKNLEIGWIEQDGPVGDVQRDVVSRIGAQSVNVRFLSGGLANRNYALGSDKVLRVYGRPKCENSIEIEDFLNNVDWKNFSSPLTIFRGEDYLLQKFLQYREFTESSRDGHLAGRVLGEIHAAGCGNAVRYNMKLAEIFRARPLTQKIITTMEWAFNSISEKKSHFPKGLLQAIRLNLESSVNSVSEQIEMYANDIVLLHGDCKPSNVKIGVDGRAVVFDWEFSFVGPRVVDLGHFLRWGAQEEFIDAFISGYYEESRIDVSGMLEAAKWVDLINVLFQLEKSAAKSVREVDILNYLSVMTDMDCPANKRLQSDAVSPRT